MRDSPARARVSGPHRPASDNAVDVRDAEHHSISLPPSTFLQIMPIQRFFLGDHGPKHLAVPQISHSASTRGFARLEWASY